MIIAALVLFVLTLICFVIAVNSESVASLIIGGLSLFACIFCTSAAVNLHATSDNYTGYIYSSEKSIFGVNTYHIRFSENAGMDKQPSFCVGTNHKDVSDKLNQYVGSGKKVQITYPAYFYLSNDPGTCGSDGITVKEVK